MIPIRLVIVDDHALVRSGIRKLLEDTSDFEILGEAGDVPQALAILRATSASILLMDISLPGESGLEAIARISAEFPELRIILLSMHASGAFVRRARFLGAAGYVIKDRSPDELVDVIRRVADGASFVEGLNSTFANGEEADVLSDLTARQIEILRLVAQGFSSREIAAQLFIAEKTVEHHRGNIKRVLGISDTAGLVLFAVRQGLISPRPGDGQPALA